MDAALSSKYAPTTLSNFESLRYVKGLLVASELVGIDGNDYIINPLSTALVIDIIANAKKITPPTEESEYETYWNTMSYGVYDIITPENKGTYSAFFPNLLK